MDTREAYQVFGLDHSASDAELKARWRKLVATWHPDRNPAADAVQRMQGINKAYQHIRMVRDGGLPDEPPPDDTPGSPEPGPHPDASDPSGATPPPRAPHVRKVRLSLDDACLGCTRTVRGHFNQTCRACNGGGQQILATHCASCKGNGKIRKPVLFGWSWAEEACAACDGDGRARAPCDRCEGTGTETVSYRRRVRFPSGTRHGQVLNVPTARHGDLDVDLELHVEIEPHPLFTLDDDNLLRCDMPVNGYAWLTGSWVDVPTPDGVQHMRLNRDALAYRLAGRGFPLEPNGPRGDFVVRITPTFTPLDETQQAMLDQLIAANTQLAQSDPNHPLADWSKRMAQFQKNRQAD
jgi:molecular chaperone DnaJ